MLSDDAPLRKITYKVNVLPARHMSIGWTEDNQFQVTTDIVSTWERTIKVPVGTLLVLRVESPNAETGFTQCAIYVDDKLPLVRRSRGESYEHRNDQHPCQLFLTVE